MKTNSEQNRHDDAGVAQKHPGTVVVMVNDKDHCNIDCTHCYLPYEGVRDPKDTLKLVTDLRKQYEKVIVAGSETLMNLGYLDSYKATGQKHLLTNGILLDKDPTIFDKLRDAGIEELQISFHFGIQKDLQSVPEQIVQRVTQAAIERGFFVQISTTITPDNFKNVVAMCEHVRSQMGAQAIEFINYIKSGSACSEQRMELTSEEKEEFFVLVDAARSQYEKSEFDIRIHGNFGPKKGSRGEKMAECNTYCPAGEELFVIDPKGTVSGCPFLMEHPIGKLEDGGITVENDPFGNARNICRTAMLSQMGKPGNSEAFVPLSNLTTMSLRTSLSSEEMDAGKSMRFHPVLGTEFETVDGVHSRLAEDDIVFEPSKHKFKINELFGPIRYLRRIGDGENYETGHPYPEHWNFCPYTGENLRKNPYARFVDK